MNKNDSWIIAMFSFALMLTMNASAQSPLLKYTFNETGNTANNIGSITDTTANLSFYNASGNIIDMHSASGTGVGGIGRSFDNSAISGMAKDSSATSVVSTTSKNTIIGTLQSFTITGWYNADESMLAAAGGAPKLVEFTVSNSSGFTISAPSANKLQLYVNSTSTAIGSSTSTTYALINQWVFFAVTYDSSSGTVNFYSGTESGTTTLVSSTTGYNQGAVAFGTNSVGYGFGNGSHGNNGDNRPFDGYMDEIQLFGTSTADGTGALSLSQIEAVRLSAIPEPSTVALVVLASFAFIIVNGCRRHLCKSASILALAFVSLASLCFAQEKVLVQSDWKNANSGPYAENARIGSGNHAFFVKSPVDFMVSVDEVGSDKVVRFTNNMGKAGVAGLLANIPEFSGDKIEGKMKFKVLPLKEGKRGTLIFALNSSRLNTTGKDVTAVQITVASDLTLLANNGQSEFAKWDKKLTIGEAYEIRYQANFSDPAQDTFEFSLHDANGAELFKSATLKTRAPNITPGALLLLGASTDAKSADPFIEIQEVSLLQK